MPTTYWNLTYGPTGEKFVLTFIDGENLKTIMMNGGGVFTFIPAGRETGEVLLQVGPSIPITLEKVTGF